MAYAGSPFLLVLLFGPRLTPKPNYETGGVLQGLSCSCLFFFFAPRSLPRLVALPSDLGLPSQGTHACLTSIRMHLPHLYFSPTQ